MVGGDSPTRRKPTESATENNRLSRADRGFGLSQPTGREASQEADRVRSPARGESIREVHGR